jgi:hypothetical protein
MVGADLQRLVSAHDQPGLAILLVLEQPDISSTALLPLAALAVELEELSTHLEHLFLGLLVGLGLDLLREVHNRLEVNVGFLLISSVLLERGMSASCSS